MTLLPVKLSVPEDNLYKMKMFLAGDKKIGKTSFANSFKNPFIIQFEPGNSAHLACRSVDIRDTLTLRQIIQQLKEKPDYCNTLVVDGIQMLYEIIMSEVCSSRGISSPEEAKHGQAWGAIGTRWRELVNELNGLQKLTIYTGHAEWKYDKHGSPTEYDAVLMSQPRKTMKNLTHMWFYMTIGENDTRELVIQPSITHKAGHNLGNRHFGGRKKINLGKSPEEANKLFMAAWTEGTTKKFRIRKKGNTNV